jgi:hypothetical protein
MSDKIIPFALLTALLLALPIFARAEPPPAKPRLGMNLNGPCDWNTELPFVDVFRLSRTWISQKKGLSWGKGPELSLDEHGWVKKLEADCFAETPMCTIEKGHYPSGRYTVLFEGKGQLTFSGAASIAESQPNRMVIQVDSSKGGFFLQLRATDPVDPVRNIRVIMPGFEDSYAKQPFHPEFLARWRGVACLRFMDWMKTNGSRISMWSERPRPDDVSFTPKGIPVEVMVALCNQQKADAWFCMPHLADDEYIRRFAQLVKESLSPELKVYIEFSNEVWNGMFAQSKWAGEQGVKLGFAKQPWEAGWAFTAYRSVQIFRMWEEVFGGRQRLVRVLPSQAANPYVSERVLTFQDAYKQADVLAIAPYMGFCVPAKSGKQLNAETVASWSVDQVLDHMASVVLPETVEMIRKQKGAAEKYGLRLVSYEAGQHMVGVAGGENNEAMNKLFYAANAHPRMGELYRTYFGAWTAAGGDLLCYFSSVGNWSKWGSWGILQFADEPAASAPKYRATLEWAKQCGQPVSQTGAR